MGARPKENKQTKKIKAGSKKKTPKESRRSTQKEPGKRPHFLQLNMNLPFYFICVQYLFSIFGFNLLTSTYFSGFKLSF